MEVQPLQEFTRFLELPPELRDLIWDEARREERRTLVIFQKNHAVNEYDVNRRKKRFSENEWAISDNYGCITPVPSLLHVCQESRKATEKFFTLLFDRIYVNLDNDTVVLNKNLTFLFDTDLGIHLIQSMVEKRAVLENLRVIKHMGFVTPSGVHAWHKEGMERSRRGYLVRLPDLESMSFYLSSAADMIGDIELAKSAGEEVDRMTDPLSFYEAKKLREAIKKDYDCMDWATDFGKEVLKAQMDNVGGEIPPIKVYRCKWLEGTNGGAYYQNRPWPAEHGSLE